MKIYLAGPMRGKPQFNFPAFHTAAAQLRAEGHEVWSPAERDEEVFGATFGTGNAEGSEAVAVVEHNFSLRQALGADLAWICWNAEAIALLPGWESSKGACAERAAALALGLEIREL